MFDNDSILNLINLHYYLIHFKMKLFDVKSFTLKAHFLVPSVLVRLSSVFGMLQNPILFRLPKTVGLEVLLNILLRELEDLADCKNSRSDVFLVTP